LDPFFDANRAWWDAVVPIHEASRGYDREAFLRAEKPLCPVELAELAPRVSGKTLLHLQCHFGMDTLNWARLGASVTGLDFSEPAIEAARRLSADSGVAGRFVCANVYDAPVALGEVFDIVYTGIGALNWLPDVERWAVVAASCLRPSGSLYVYDAHPMLNTLEPRRDGQLCVERPYFETAEPTTSDSDRTYVDGPRLEVQRNYEWNHGLGEIVSALVSAGLRLEFVHEHRAVPWRALSNLELAGPDPGGADARYQSGRMWQLPESQRDLVPLMYSLLATKPPE
jgi:SAM-dependent methyltransferase